MKRHAAVLLLMLGSQPAGAVPAVTGIAKRAYYVDTATVTVTRTAGNIYAAWIDGVAVDPALPYTETRFGYHEFKVTETIIASQLATTDTWQFIVKDSYRGGASDTYPEAGLARWTPLRSIDAPAEVLDAVHDLQIIAPARLPAGFSLPIIARLKDAGGTSAKLIGTLLIGGVVDPATLRLYRGAGSRTIHAPASTGSQFISCKLGSRVVIKPLTVEAAPVWQPLSGAAGGQTIPPNTFIDVTGNVTVAANTTLTIGAGCVLRCAQGVEFEILGALTVNGTALAPVLFAPATGSIWGGIWVHGATAQAQLHFAMLTGGGANPSWITQHSMNSHKSQEPLFTWSDNAGGSLEDCAIVDNPAGQCLHGQTSTTSFAVRRCLLQKSISGGQIADCTLVWEQNHLIEMPLDDPFADAVVADADYDGLYLSGGTATLSQSVFGWVKDDGIDSGSGATSLVTVNNCWFESCLHEGMAWSEGGTRTARDCVAMNCGQGMECGFTGQGAGTPAVDAQRIYCTGNHFGIRYGDNYNWSYGGKFDVHDSLSLYNFDDVFGIHWGTFVGGSGKNWTYVGANRTTTAYMHLEALGAPQNWDPTIVSAPQAEHPTLPTWNPTDASHLAKLAPFLTLPTAASGCGVAQETKLFPRAAYGGRVTVRLDRTVTVTRVIPWTLFGKTSLDASQSTPLASGTLTMPAGCQAAAVSMPIVGAGATVIVFSLQDSNLCTVTGPRSVAWVDLNFPPPPPTPEPLTLLPRTTNGWKYLAQSTAAPAGWEQPGFNDAAWVGPVVAPLQTGEAALGGTSVPSNSANGTRPFNTVYFRRSFNVTDKNAFATLTANCMRDDGVVVYLNGQVLKYDNLPNASPTSNTAAVTTISGTTEATWNNWSGLAPTALVNGPNLLAIEVHQSDITGTPPLTTSGDMRLDFELLGQPPTPIPPIHFTTALVGPTQHLFWSEAALMLQSNPNLSGTWMDLPEQPSPFPIIPDVPRQFFRLKRP